LTQAGIILKYSINFDADKLGYKTFLVNMSLSNYENKNKIVKYLSDNPFIWEIRRTIGNNDIEMILYSTNFEHFYRIMEDLRSTFPNSIANYDYLYVTKTHKMNSLPDESEDM
jgi:DNA-binding Lrp family transcriptional regulator